MITGSVHDAARSGRSCSQTVITAVGPLLGLAALTGSFGS
ncbi:MAG: hypothetical protein QOI16_3322 [Pseudonocardiales bacterium]|jgi:hypothetical protein|nr:hypothetical protein [Pseudonocardiales bacterium]